MPALLSIVSSRVSEQNRPLLFSVITSSAHLGYVVCDWETLYLVIGEMKQNWERVLVGNRS